MFKLVSPYRGINFLRRFGVRVRLTSAKKRQCPTVRFSNLQFLTYNRHSSSDSRIRNFYEYPDVNRNEDEARTPYTSWEGVENRYAHSVMEKDKAYESTISVIPSSNNPTLSKDELELLLCKNYRLSPVSELVNNFRAISHHAKANYDSIYDPEFKNIITSLAGNSKILSDDQICDVLKSLALWFVESNQDDSSFSLLYTALDSECNSRAKSWSSKQILLVSDHWYRLRLMQRSKFVERAILRLGKSPQVLTDKELVQLMFYASVSRSSLINFREIEWLLQSHLRTMNIDEIAIVALGFFKTQTKIRDRRLIAIIIERTIKEIESINEISLAAILKIVRYSIHINDLNFLCKLLENTIPQIPRLSVTCLVHIILAAANRGLFFAELLNAVAARFYREISKVRVKDIRCLVFALSSFNYVPEKQPNILDRVIKELNKSERQSELKRYPQCFATCLHHLSILNIHPKNLIAQALDPASIQKAYGSNVNTIRREILALDLSIDAEIPDYQGPRLDTETRENLAMRMTDWPPLAKTSEPTATNLFMLDVIRTCEEYLGSKEMVHVDHVLPQYQRPDIIICLDKTNSPVPLSSSLSKLPFGNVKHPPKISLDDVRWLALVIGSKNSSAKNTNRLLGQTCAKKRQLKYIGYRPFLILWQDWEQLANDAEKFKYLQCKVFF